MRTRHAQRGFMLIAAIFLLVVAAVFASVLAFRVSGGNQSSGDTLTRAQALYLAKTGLERWIRQRALSNTFTGEGPTSYGNGTFTTTSSSTDCDGNALPATQLRVQSVGTVSDTSASVTLCAVVDLLRVGGAMMVYAKENPAASVGVPFYRRWSSVTNAWGAEAQANDVGTNIQFMVLKFARTRNEAILGTMNADGQIHVQVWNGTAWGAATQLVDLPNAQADQRGFDIEYEAENDRAVVVFNNNTRNPQYRIWDGTSWSAQVGLNVDLGGNYNTGSAQEPRWIELAANPGGSSNEIALLTLDDSSEVYGVRWTGTAWARMDASTTSWDTAATDTTKVIDVAYEQLSGRAMYIWGYNVGAHRYRIWDGTTLSAATTLSFVGIPGPDMTSEPRWIRLVPRPRSDELLFAVQDEDPALFTAFWNGTTWASHTRHDAATEDSADRNFDIVFETHPSNGGMAWLMWGSTTGADFTRVRQWNGSSWGGTTSIGQEAAFAVLTAHPSSGAVFGGVYEDTSSPTDNIEEYHLISGGSTWTQSVSPVWGGPTSGNPVHQRVDIAAERYTPVVSWREVLP